VHPLIAKPLPIFFFSFSSVSLLHHTGLFSTPFLLPTPPIPDIAQLERPLFLLPQRRWHTFRFFPRMRSSVMQSPSRIRRSATLDVYTPGLLPRRMPSRLWYYELIIEWDFFCRLKEVGSPCALFRSPTFFQ